MKPFVAFLLIVFHSTVVAAAPLDDLYHLGPDSMAQEGVPQGKVVGPTTLPSKAAR